MLHMERKDYIYEIVLAILKYRNHVRGLARIFSTNHMMISRKMGELVDRNVVDYKEEGRNKVYFIKKTAEAKNYVFMAEQYKLLRLLNKYPQLRSVIDKTQKDNKIKLSVL